MQTTNTTRFAGTKRKAFLGIMTLALAVTAAFGIQLADAPYAHAATPKVYTVKYEGKGKVDVDFSQKVKYQSTFKVSVKDAKGNAYSTTVIEKDSDDLEFKINKYKAGTYTVTLKGIKASGTTKYGTMTLDKKVKIPAASSVKVEETDFDAEDKELSVDFVGKVSWNKPTVQVLDANGTNHVSYILEKGSDELELKVKGMSVGKKYTLKITGIKSASATSWTTLTKTFTAYGD